MAFYCVHSDLLLWTLRNTANSQKTSCESQLGLVLHTDLERIGVVVRAEDGVIIINWDHYDGSDCGPDTRSIIAKL